MKVSFTIGLLFMCTINISCQTGKPSEENSLIVYGEGFSFGVKTPESWKGDMDNASKYHANIVFYKNSQELQNGGQQMTNWKLIERLYLHF